MALTKTNLANIVEGILPVANGGTGTSTGVSPGGSTTQVQYNNAGAFAGSANLVFDGTNLTVGATSNVYGGTLGLFSSGNTRLDIATTGATAQQILSFGQNGTAKWQLISDLPATGSGRLDFVLPGTGSQVTINSSGNVGIGTSNPTQKLQVESASNVTIQLTKTGVASFGITNNGAAGTVLNVESVPMIFNTANTERMRITSAGGVSFGATGTAYGTSGQVLTSAGNAPPTWTTLNALTSGTQVSVSGKSVDVTGIPSWAKRVTMIVNAVSTNGSSNLRFQVGSGSISTSGYSAAMIGVTSGQGTSGTNAQNGLSGLDVYVYSQNATYAFFGTVVWTLVGSNTWTAVATVATSQSTSIGFFGGSSPALGGALDRVRITTSGTDDFDAGTINILYE
jgi:hypothetical protein